MKKQYLLYGNKTYTAGKETSVVVECFMKLISLKSCVNHYFTEFRKGHEPCSASLSQQRLQLSRCMRNPCGNILIGKYPQTNLQVCKRTLNTLSQCYTCTHSISQIYCDSPGKYVGRAGPGQLAKPSFISAFLTFLS